MRGVIKDAGRKKGEENEIQLYFNFKKYILKKIMLII